MNPAHLEVPASTYQRVNRGIGGSFPRARQKVCVVTGPYPYVNASLTCHSRAPALVCDVGEPLKVVGVEMVAVAASAAAAAVAVTLCRSHPL